MFQSSLSIKDRNPPMENRKGHRAQEEMKKNLKANIKHHHIDLNFRKVISQQSSACQSPKFYLKFDEKNPNMLEQYHSSKTRRSVFSNVSPATLQSERSPKEIKSNYRQSPQDFTQRKTPNNLYSKSLNQGLQIKKPNSTPTMAPGAKTLHKQKSKEHTKGKSQDVFDPKSFQNFLEKSTKSKSLTGVQSYREIGSKSPIDFFGLEKSSSIENPSIVLDRKRSDLVLSNSRSLVSTALNTKIHSQMVSPKLMNNEILPLGQLFKTNELVGTGVRLEENKEQNKIRFVNPQKKRKTTNKFLEREKSKEKPPAKKGTSTERVRSPEREFLLNFEEEKLDRIRNNFSVEKMLLTTESNRPHSKERNPKNQIRRSEKSQSVTNLLSAFKDNRPIANYDASAGKNAGDPAFQRVKQQRSVSALRPISGLEKSLNDLQQKNQHFLTLPEPDFISREYLNTFHNERADTGSPHIIFSRSSSLGCLEYVQTPNILYDEINPQEFVENDKKELRNKEQNNAQNFPKLSEFAREYLLPWSKNFLSNRNYEENDFKVELDLKTRHFAKSIIQSSNFGFQRSSTPQGTSSLNQRSKSKSKSSKRSQEENLRRSRGTLDFGYKSERLGLEQMEKLKAIQTWAEKIPFHTMQTSRSQSREKKEGNESVEDKMKLFRRRESSSVSPNDLLSFDKVNEKEKLVNKIESKYISLKDISDLRKGDYPGFDENLEKNSECTGNSSKKQSKVGEDNLFQIEVDKSSEDKERVIQIEKEAKEKENSKRNKINKISEHQLNSPQPRDFRIEAIPVENREEISEQNLLNENENKEIHLENLFKIAEEKIIQKAQQENISLDMAMAQYLSELQYFLNGVSENSNYMTTEFSFSDYHQTRMNSSPNLMSPNKDNSIKKSLLSSEDLEAENKTSTLKKIEAPCEDEMKRFSKTITRSIQEIDSAQEKEDFELAVQLMYKLLEDIQVYEETKELNNGKENFEDQTEASTIKHKNHLKKTKVQIGNKLGTQLYKNGKYAEALDELNKVLSIDAHNIQALYKVHETHIKLGNKKEARIVLKTIKDLMLSSSSIEEETRTKEPIQEREKEVPQLQTKMNQIDTILEVDESFDDGSETFDH